MAGNIDLDGIFKEIVSRFESAGVTDSVLIAEHVAFFALCWYSDGTWNSLKGEVFGTDREMSGGSYVSNLQDLLPRHLFKANLWLESTIFGADPRSLQPSAPTGMQAAQLKNLIDLFEILFNNISDLGEWFDKTALPRLFKTMQGGGQYATPRHLETFMAHLLKINETDSIVDFACGTGGMLVAAGKVQRATGVEISPNMARLALTNLILHGQGQENLYLGNAFYIARQIIGGEQFDAVLMNPPFGIKVDPALVDISFRETNSRFGWDFKGSSETMFAALAYDKLKISGRMAVMVPSGTLFSSSRGEVKLRGTLVGQGALRAIISLPRDAVQPYSDKPPHIIYAVKAEEHLSGGNSVWFYRPRYDGLRGRRNRQLDLEHNDLPLIETAIDTPGSSDKVQVILLKNNSKLVGYRVECAEGVDILVEKPGTFIIYILDKSQSRKSIGVSGEKIARDQDVPEGKRLIGREIFRSDKAQRGIVFDTNGEIVGVQVAQDILLSTEDYNLQSEHYWPTKRSTLSTLSAAQILGDIKKNQNKLTSTIDRLLSISEVQPVGVAELPSRLQASNPPPSLLSGIQQQIWEIVLTKTEPAGNYSTPIPFQADDIQPVLGEAVSIMDVERTLELFERLGLIVAVSYEGAPYYRLPTVRDIEGAPA